MRSLNNEEKCWLTCRVIGRLAGSDIHTQELHENNMMFIGTGKLSLSLHLGWKPLKCILVCDILPCNPDLTSLECVPTRNSLSSFHLWLINSYLIHSVTMPKSSRASHGPKAVHVSRASRHPPSWSVKTETIPALHRVHNCLPVPGLLVCNFIPLTAPFILQYPL